MTSHKCVSEWGITQKTRIPNVGGKEAKNANMLRATTTQKKGKTLIQNTRRARPKPSMNYSQTQASNAYIHARN